MVPQGSALVLAPLVPVILRSRLCADDFLFLACPPPLHVREKTVLEYVCHGVPLHGGPGAFVVAAEVEDRTRLGGHAETKVDAGEDASDEDGSGDGPVGVDDVVVVNEFPVENGMIVAEIGINSNTKFRIVPAGYE